MSDGLPPEENDPAPQERAAEQSAEQSEEQGTAGRRTTVMIVAAAVVVLLAIGVGIYLVATSGEEDVAADPAPPEITGASPTEPPSSAPLESRPASSPPATKAPPKPADKNVAAVRTAAEQAASAINERDIDAMKKLSCDPSTVGSVEAFPPEATARLAENPQITGDKATAQIELSISGSEPTVVPLPMEKRGGKWCVP
jgi:type IV secretory pathway VirB10-like protein